MADIFRDEFDSAEEIAEVEDFVFASMCEDVCEETQGYNDRGDIEEQISDSEVNVDSTAAISPEFRATTLEELANSDYIRNRQLAAQSIVEYLHQAGSNKEALHSVISIMCKLSEDEDFMVRSELMEHIPSIALFCKDHSEDLGVVIRQQLVPYTVKQLTDSQIQVRKIGHSAMLVLLQHSIIDNSQLSEWICPLLSQLITSTNTSEELRCEDVSVMCKMIPYVGKEITEKFFLEPFISLCCDSAFTIRKICALNIGSVCKIVGTETTESMLLPAFLNLCNDEIWGIRKECADVFVDVASIVNFKTRESVLPHIFVNLLNDDSRYVKLAAYQSLGGFISTFADPWKTGLQYKDGSWRKLYPFPVENQECADNRFSSDCAIKENETLGEIQNNNLYLNNIQYVNESTARPLNNSRAHNLNLSTEDFADVNCDTEKIRTYSSIKGASVDQLSDENSNVNALVKTRVQNMSINQKRTRIQPPHTVAAKDGHLHLHVDNENGFNNFQFWRTPLPEIEFDIDIEEGKGANIHVKAKVQSEDSAEVCASELNVKISPGNNSRNSVLPNMKIGVEKMAVEADCVNTYSTPSEELKIVESAALPEAPVKSYLRNLSSESEPVEEPELNFSLNRISDRLDMSSESVIALCKEYNEKHYKIYKNSMKTCVKELTAYDQDIVPPELLARFISSGQSELPNEDEKTLYCAFSFPAVAYTLGRKYWLCIRSLYNLLARDIRYIVRKTVAASLHELAVILDHDIIVEDLLPVFLEMLKDVDEVRIKVLMHLYDFLKHLKPQERRQFLPLIEEEFFTVERESNWRFRYTVAEQLIPCVELFSSSEIQSHLLPVPLSLMLDKASNVRRSAVELVAVIIRSLVADSKTSFCLKILLSVFDARYRQANKWLQRQTYVFICQELANKKSLPVDVYVDEVVPSLFSLAWDSVPNVRLAVSRCIGLTLLPLDYLPSIYKAHSQLLLQVMNSLQSDVDKDVRHFAYISAGAFNTLSQRKLQPV